MKAIVLLSGGMDSATVAYRLAAEGASIHALSFDYGQRHARELSAAADLAGRLGARHTVAGIDLPLAGSALTDPDVEVPDGHYTDASMRATVVPNRNAIFLAVAFAAAQVDGADVVGFGCHAGDHAIYPDCRSAFVEAFQRMQDLATAGLSGPRLVTPFLYQTKADIVRAGRRYAVPWEATWSCYRGNDVHCGRCGTCTERREAFVLARVADPTSYAAAA